MRDLRASRQDRSILKLEKVSGCTVLNGDTKIYVYLGSQDVTSFGNRVCADKIS